MVDDGKRRVIIIAIIGILVIIVIIAVIVGISVSQSKASKGKDKALLFFPNGNGSAIKIKQGLDNEPYLYSLKSLLSGYSRDEQTGPEFMDCSRGQIRPADTDLVCSFNIDNLGPSCTEYNMFGFTEGQPCFILQLKPPKDWKPQLFNNTKHVPVQCKPSMNGMKDSIGVIKMYPPSGFPSNFFPYTGQKDYSPPLVAVQFENPTPGVLFMVTCTVLDPLLDETNNNAFINEFAFEVQ